MAEKKAGIIVILSSPSGAGKTTLVKKISKRKNIKFQFLILLENQELMKKMVKRLFFY